MLRVSNLALSYPLDAERRFEIFRDVNFEVRDGEILGVFGPNGCGKSSLLRAVAGLLPHEAGHVEMQSSSGSQTMAFIPQDFRESFFPWTSVAGNIRMCLPREQPLCRREADARLAATKTGLDITLNTQLRPGACSGGMLQQAAIMRAFFVEPAVILADEPFSALDVSILSRLRRRFVQLIRDNGIAAMIVLHKLEDLMEVCDRVLVIGQRPFSLNGNGEGAVLLPNRKGRSQSSENRESFIQMARELFDDVPLREQA